MNFYKNEKTGAYRADTAELNGKTLRKITEKEYNSVVEGDLEAIRKQDLEANQAYAALMVKDAKQAIEEGIPAMAAAKIFGVSVRELKL